MTAQEVAMVVVRRTYNEETDDYERESVKSRSDKLSMSCMVKCKEHTEDGGGKPTSVPEKQLGFVMIGDRGNMTPMISLAFLANQEKRSTHACFRLEQSSSAMTLRRDTPVIFDTDLNILCMYHS